MAQDPIRRSQLIAPHGVGSMLVIKGGVSVMACGLDHWYERESLDNSGIDIDEFKVEEYRLQRILNVDHFRLPPDFRTPISGMLVPNNNLNIPFVRFPRWHVCSRCNRMEKLSLIERSNIVVCNECRNNKRKGMFQQAVFVAMCEKGHLQDFPWREWAHRSARPNCDRPLRYVSTGGASLAAQRVRCDCGSERNLAGITSANPNGTTALSTRLEENGDDYLCRGHRPWLGSTEDSPCESQLRGTLRGATNVWFAKTYNAIYLPQSSELVSPDLIILLRSTRISSFTNIMITAGFPSPVEQLKSHFMLQLQPYSNEQIEAALKIIRGEEIQGDDSPLHGEDADTAFRRAEFNVLRTNRREDLLVTTPCDLRQYEPEITKYFSRIVLVSKLRETRVFGGFSRINSEREIGIDERKQMLWNEVPEGFNSWLPTNVVYGEGIFLELDENLLQNWEAKYQEALRNHLKNLVDNFERVRSVRGLKPKKLTPRFILLHTLAHLLINRLTFDCGYSSASLRERIYVSDHPESPMAGILIYTADGDSEGTMGGLVRMGNPTFFEPVLRRAIEAAEWCSADPVCREMGAKSGQGPDSCNLAACHSCGLLPETSCDEFNRFLDRSVIVNGLGEDGFAFFDI